MNDDAFEQRLEQVPLRPLPTVWRHEILAAARQNQPTRQVAAWPWWRAAKTVWARVPVAWGALASIWLAILGVNLLLPGSAVVVTRTQSAPVPPETLMAWKLQCRGAGFLADRAEDGSGSVPPSLPAHVPLPRSDRRRGPGGGGFDACVPRAC